MKGSLKRAWIPAFAGMTIMVSSLCAQTNSGFSFLKIGVGARPVGLGSAYTALANDASALYWNPAGLGSLRKREVSAMHANWLLGSSYDFIGTAMPSRIGTWGMGVSMLSHPEQEGRDAQGNKTSNFSARDSAFMMALSPKLGVSSQLGVGVKFIESRIGQDSGQGFAFDLGAMKHMPNTPLSLGASLQNLGPGVRFISERTRLPLTASFGAAYHVIAGLAISADLRHRVYESKNQWSIGSEYGLGSNFALRGGYSLAGGSGNSLAGLGTGFGLKVLGYRMDYAFTPFGALGDTHRLNLSTRW